MKLTSNVRLLSAASLAAIGIASPLAAQTAGDGAGDIIVTARRTEERLQDVPISMTVFSNEQIAKQNIVIASDLATYTPSLSVNLRYGPEKAAFAIRGFNQELGTAPTVGVYFADVVGVRAQGGTTSGNTVGAGSFTDLQNVQVLKGPQGTLFGRNTTGGAILLVPQKPTDNVEGYLEGSAGNFDMRRVQGAFNVPLADTFKVRLSVDRMKRDGYMRNRAEVGPKAYNDADYFYGRLSVVADLTPDLENYTIAHYSKSETNGYAARLTNCDDTPITFPGQPGYNPTKDPTSSSFSFQKVVTGRAACDQIARQNARGDGALDVEVGNANPFLKIEQWQVINTTTWRASDTLTIKNIMSYGEFREGASFTLNSDNFFVPALPAPLQGQLLATRGQPFGVIVLDRSPGYNAASQSTFTEELQLQGQSSDGRLNYVVGGYLEFSRPLSWNQQRTAIYGNCDTSVPQCATPIGFALISQSRTRFNFDNHGIFGQGTFRFTDQLALTAGARYTFDKITGVSESTRYLFSPVPGLGVQLIEQVCNDSIAHPDVNIGGLTGDGSGDSRQCRVTNAAKSNKPTWLIGLDYKPSGDVLIYAKYARGYRQGGVNFTTVGLETWEPEKVESYEIGAKTSFRGAVPGYFNIAAFYNDFSGQQIFGGLVPRADSGLSGAAGLFNAGSSVLKGIEIDAAATFFDSLDVSVGYAYLDTKLKELTIPDLSNTLYEFFDPFSVVGGPLTYAPKHRMTVSGTYTLPLDESIGEISVGATYTYTSNQIANESSPIGILPASNLLNLNLNWDRVGGSDLDLAAFATNVTNEQHVVSVNGGFNSYGFDGKHYGAPRMYGVRLRWNFGQ